MVDGSEADFELPITSPFIMPDPHSGELRWKVQQQPTEQEESITAEEAGLWAHNLGKALGRTQSYRYETKPKQSLKMKR